MEAEFFLIGLKKERHVICKQAEALKETNNFINTKIEHTSQKNAQHTLHRLDNNFAVSHPK